MIVFLSITHPQRRAGRQTGVLSLTYSRRYSESGIDESKLGLDT